MSIFGNLAEFIALGGPVLVILLVVSLVAVTLIVLKVLQFRQEGVGDQRQVRKAISQWDDGRRAETQSGLSGSDAYLAKFMTLAIRLDGGDGARKRAETEAEQKFLKLESGLRFLDIVSQLAPLLGLFGTVLGMIEAFQALQGAGSQVDPSILAGGIWVALMTTAAGLAVAMPVSMVVSWLEGRLDADRALADLIISAIAAPIPQLQNTPKTARKSKASPDPDAVEVANAANDERRKAG